MMSKVFKTYDLKWWMIPKVFFYKTEMERNLGRHIAF
jgi:hypothetical protein